ncbi:unnamed protein product [Nesidiocoris tenuis]|uniref:Laminin G domain-containing protein n=2 Tax=Nesidiocoris tenuis TaxID=355587 RepID=A0A6H5FVT0_9HEMI|nr:unnamed protein product [Nesidiocoris tenuis]
MSPPKFFSLPLKTPIIPNLKFEEDLSAAFLPPGYKKESPTPPTTAKTTEPPATTFVPRNRNTQGSPRPTPTTRRPTSTTRTTTTPKPSTLTALPSSPSTLPSEVSRPEGPANRKPGDDNSSESPTESWVVVASVQTSRSVSGARFLPGHIVKQEETQKHLTPNETPTTTTEPSTSRPRTFVPSGKRTTLKPKKSLLDSIQYDEIGAGLLPPGFKPRESTFKPKHSSREGSGRSAGSTFKNSVKDESKGSNAEKETGQGTNRTLESIIGKKVQFKDVSALLPPDFKEKSNAAPDIAEPIDAAARRPLSIARRGGNRSGAAPLGGGRIRSCATRADRRPPAVSANRKFGPPIRARWSARSVSDAMAPLLLLISIACVGAFTLEGSSTSYAQFRKWNAGLNGTLELEFRTEQANGLLLYTDDGGTYDFFELKLVEGALRLRYNLGGGAQILTAGRDLNDGHWHKVQLKRLGDRTSLTVDGETQTRTSRGKEFNFGRLASNSDVYVGGMPSWYNTKLTLLALPSVIFEPRFGGSVRNLVYADDESPLPRRQEIRMKDHKVR